MLSIAGLSVRTDVAVLTPHQVLMRNQASALAAKQGRITLIVLKIIAYSQSCRKLTPAGEIVNISSDDEFPTRLTTPRRLLVRSSLRLRYRSDSACSLRNVAARSPMMMTETKEWRGTTMMSMSVAMCVV